jgi:two-component system phosphate regulon sensor histidine kinase PhoR
VDVKLKEVLETLKPLANAKNIIIDVDLHTISFVSDPLDMIKLFKNPIENAIKYSPEKSKIHVQLHQIDQTLMFQVIDEGYGIPEQFQPRVFERFYRIEKDRIQGGTGLGLAIVKHIVLKYDGTYSLSSTPNEGTSITIHIPMKKIK